MIDEHTPILVGCGQMTQRVADPASALDPLSLMAEVARAAARDAGAPARLLDELDTVAVVNVLSWEYGNAPGALAARLGASPARCLYTTIGGNTPQWLVNETAEQIAAGKVRQVLLVGSEAMATVARARRAGVRLNWSDHTAGTSTLVGDGRPGTNDHEMLHGLILPAAVYPMFENAVRAHRGWSLAEHRAHLGKLCNRFSAVAARNPSAWFQLERTPENISTVTAENRLIGFPYPKYMNAIMDVDQAAAVLVTSVGRARELGIDPSRWVYLWGCADLHDRWSVSERDNYYSSPAIKAAGECALNMAGLQLGDIDLLDLYSCFPCAVQIACEMLGITADDPRPPTVTGGLPYHGGPGNNYTMHSIATMMDRLRAAPGKTGLVTGLGWYMTKHAIGIYSTEPPAQRFRRPDLTRTQGAINSGPHPELALQPNGHAVIETYTVLHDRDGEPMRGIIVGRLDDGRRFLANTPTDRAVFTRLESDEAIGLEGTVAASTNGNRFDLR